MLIDIPIGFTKPFCVFFPWIFITFACLFSVPDCPNAIPTVAPQESGAGSQCLMGDIQACGAGMACVQDEAGSPSGVCSCLPGFSVQDDRSCLSVQEEEIRIEEEHQADVTENIDGQARPKKSAAPAPAPASVELPRHVTSFNGSPQVSVLLLFNQQTCSFPFSPNS